MEHSEIAELQVLLEGVPLPSERAALVRYALHEGASGAQLALLRRLPERRFETIDQAAEELLRVQPSRADEVPHEPHEESGAPPGGETYTEPHPESGAVRT